MKEFALSQLARHVYSVVGSLVPRPYIVGGVCRLRSDPTVSLQGKPAYPRANPKLGPHVLGCYVPTPMRRQSGRRLRYRAPRTFLPSNKVQTCAWALPRITFHCCFSGKLTTLPELFGTPREIRTLTDMVLNHMPLPIGLPEHCWLRSPDLHGGRVAYEAAGS